MLSTLQKMSKLGSHIISVSVFLFAGLKLANEMILFPRNAASFIAAIFHKEICSL